MLRDFSKDAFDVIIQAGQSNADGTGFGPADQPYEPDDRVWYLTRDFVIQPAAEAVCGNEVKGDFSLAFASEYIKAGLLAEGRKLLIIRAAVGGTGFSDHRWGEEDDLFVDMMELIKTALALNPENRLKVLLWHQGETDAGNLVPREAHRENLMRLMSLVRRVFHCPELPFIAGDFVQQWKYWLFGIADTVVHAVRDVCGSIGNAAFVESEGLKSNEQQYGVDDIIHFSRDALNKLGQRYFEAYIKIIGTSR